MLRFSVAFFPVWHKIAKDGIRHESYRGAKKQNECSLRLRIDKAILRKRAEKDILEIAY